MNFLCAEPKGFDPRASEYPAMGRSDWQHNEHACALVHTTRPACTRIAHCDCVCAVCSVASALHGRAPLGRPVVPLV